MGKEWTVMKGEVSGNIYYQCLDCGSSFGTRHMVESCCINTPSETPTYATPRWLMAVGDEIEQIAVTIKREGGQKCGLMAYRLRNLADILERKT